MRRYDAAPAALPAQLIEGHASITRRLVERLLHHAKTDGLFVVGLRPVDVAPGTAGLRLGTRRKRRRGVSFRLLPARWSFRSALRHPTVGIRASRVVGFVQGADALVLCVHAVVYPCAGFRRPFGLRASFPRGEP